MATEMEIFLEVKRRKFRYRWLVRVLKIALRRRPVLVVPKDLEGEPLNMRIINKNHAGLMVLGH
ncbi:hypothetical protein OROHE_009594 [Orobanche hederae]